MESIAREVEMQTGWKYLGSPVRAVPGVDAGRRCGGRTR
jgi:hypothetical protein